MSVPDPDSVKMFVGQIPRTMEEDELKQIMEAYGPVYQAGVIRDKASGQHRGKCVCVCIMQRILFAGRGGLVVECLPAVWEDPGSNLTVGSQFFSRQPLRYTALGTGCACLLYTSDAADE